MTNAANGSQEAFFSIHFMERLEDDSLQYAAKPGRPPCFEVFYILKGEGFCSVDLDKFEIRDNMILFLRPDQVHRFQTKGGLPGFRICFTESFFCLGGHEDDLWSQSALMESIPGYASLPMHKDSSHDMREVLMKMLREYNNDCLFRTEMLRRYLKIFLVYVARQFEDSLERIMQSGNIEMVQKFKSRVDKNFITTKTVAGYAAMLYVSPNYLNAVVKKRTGYPATYHIRQRIVLEAKRKATYSGLCMKEIAYYLGFMDISHFSKYFKNAAGVSFSDFKKERFQVQIND